MKIRRIEIVSNNICYGHKSYPTNELEQHLTIEVIEKVYTNKMLDDIWGLNHIKRDKGEKGCINGVKIL